MNVPKRVLKDIQNFQKSNLEDQGIYCFFCDENIFKVNIMIIGPKDTPYENGFYFFRLTFPPNYPWSPPNVIYYTQGQNIRFNPNLYVNGKVCVSILNTWSGPGWTSCCTLNSVVLSLQSLLNENPIQNEPGWGKIDITDERAKSYNNVLKYSNFRFGIIDSYIKPYKYFVCFKKIIKNYIENNLSFYMNLLQNLKNQYPKKKLIKSHIYSLFIEVDSQYCEDKFKYIIDTLATPNKNIETISINNCIDENNIEITKKQTNYKRKAPIKNSKFFEVGYEQISENDGKLYIVSLTKTNKKRWKLKI